MAARDKTEKVLRDFHVLFSKAQPLNGGGTKVVVDKNEVMDLLKELNDCMYGMMEEYEMTVTSRDKAKRELEKENDEKVFEASRKAEDIYAASVMYTDNALNEIQDAIKKTQEKMETIYQQTEDKLKEQERIVKQHQLDLKSQLQDLIDTQKYLRLIDDENQRRLKEKASGREETYAGEPNYASVVPEIKINEDYFRAQGIALDDEVDMSESEKDLANLAEDLDKEYFEWKDDEPEDDKKSKGFNLFGKK